MRRLELGVRAGVGQFAKLSYEASRVEGLSVQVPLSDALWQVLDGADCAALVTRHREYETLDLGRLRDAMGGSALVDGRNTLDPDVCVQAGFVYRGVGKRG